MPRRAKHRPATVFLFGSCVLGTCALGSCAGPPHTRTASAAAVPLPTVDDAQPRDYAGIHNAVAYHEGFVSGSAPEGDTGFETLVDMGVRTIISVDGAVPDVAAAEAHGLRYIHLPIGYNGFDAERKLELVRATRDAMSDGPVYIHCHHGKHRSAGAAAAIASSLGWLDPDEGVARMKVSGTAPNYTGLYTCAAEAGPLNLAAVDDVPADFPSIWEPTSFVRGMVEIDEVVEHLKAIARAGWVTPRQHPDLVPAAEAGQLTDLHRILARSRAARRHPPEFTDLMVAAQQDAQVLEDQLVAGSTDTDALDAQFAVIRDHCTACHHQFRD